MNRRGFLQTTFASGLAVGTGACAAAEQRSQVPLAHDELERELAELDRTLARMDSKLAKQWFRDRRASDIEHAHGATRERIVAEGELVRTSLRTAMTVSALSELPEANHGDAEVIERLRRVSGEADFAVFGTLERLRNLDEAELAALDREAVEDPRFVEDVAEQVDALAAQLGVGTRRRAHLRAVGKHIGWRLERGRMSALIRETVTKVDESLAAAMRQIEISGVPAFADGDPGWIERTRAIVRAHQPEDPSPTDPVASEPAAVEPAEPPPTEAPLTPSEQQELENYRKAEEERQAALAVEEARLREARVAEVDRDRKRAPKFMGAGAGLLLVGGGSLVLIAAGGTALIVGVTIGSIALTVGLILLIIGLTISVRAKKRAAALGI
jgi:hypothetical protein